MRIAVWGYKPDSVFGRRPALNTDRALPGRDAEPVGVIYNPRTNVFLLPFSNKSQTKGFGVRASRARKFSLTLLDAKRTGAEETKRMAMGDPQCEFPLIPVCP